MTLVTQKPIVVAITNCTEVEVASCGPATIKGTIAKTIFNTDAGRVRTIHHTVVSIGACSARCQLFQRLVSSVQSATPTITISKTLFSCTNKPSNVMGELPSSTTFVPRRSEEHTSELQSRFDLVCRLLLEKK